MKKIAILLLLAFNSFLVVADAEINACIVGVNARNKQVGGGVTLLVTGNEPTIDGDTACSGMGVVGKNDNVDSAMLRQAACIFGYNTIIPMMFNSNVIPGNGNETNGIYPCVDWWKYNPADCAGKGGGDACGVCEYPGTKVTDAASPLYNKPDGYGVCQYGKAIGWNLSVNGPKSSLGNYYYNQQMHEGTGIINKLWGINKDPNESNRYVNWLNLIKNYINNIRSDGKNGIWTNSPINITISGADAVSRAS